MIIKKILYITAFLLLSSTAISQGPPPPGGGPGDTDPPVGRAPTGSGVLVLLTLASAFGTIKILHARISKQ
ncbi:MAG: hypothetical protein K8S00_07095 [Bacteroidales bacterium]|nr:hypothetical protein [Bacteroidales bacterium]